MQELCGVIWLVVMGCAPSAGALWSWAVRNWDVIGRWYTPLPNAVKTVLFVATAAAIGVGLGATGYYIVGCQDWPPFQQIVIDVALAIITALGGTAAYWKWQLDQARAKANGTSK